MAMDKSKMQSLDLDQLDQVFGGIEQRINEMEDKEKKKNSEQSSK